MSGLKSAFICIPLTLLLCSVAFGKAREPESVAAQRRIDEVSGPRHTLYCGAYWRYGFHEDGVVSALAVARKLGIDRCTPVCAAVDSASGVAA